MSGVTNQAQSTADKSVRELRNLGFAVVIFSPAELGKADQQSVQSRLAELGGEVISDLNSIRQ